MTNIICKQCHQERQEFIQPEWHPDRDHHGSGSWICPSCQTVVMVILDGGELDLGIVREMNIQSVNDFHIWTEQ